MSIHFTSCFHFTSCHSTSLDTTSFHLILSSSLSTHLYFTLLHLTWHRFMFFHYSLLLSTSLLSSSLHISPFRFTVRVRTYTKPKDSFWDIVTAVCWKWAGSFLRSRAPTEAKACLKVIKECILYNSLNSNNSPESSCGWATFYRGWWPLSYILPSVSIFKSFVFSLSFSVWIPVSLSYTPKQHKCSTKRCTLTYQPVQIHNIKVDYIYLAFIKSVLQ